MPVTIHVPDHPDMQLVQASATIDVFGLVQHGSSLVLRLVGVLYRWLCGYEVRCTAAFARHVLSLGTKLWL